MMFAVEEICWLYSGVLLLYKKNTRKVYLIFYPFEFNSSFNKHLIYESQSLIKRLTIFEYYHYIVEENKFVKKLDIDYKNGKYVSYVIKEYFVSPEFTGEGFWRIFDDMMIFNDSLIKLQIRGTENETMISRSTIGITEMIKDPILSEYTTLFISDYWGLCYKLKIMPNLRTPEFNILPSNLTNY